MITKPEIACKDGIHIFIDQQDQLNEQYNIAGLRRFYKVEQDHFWFVMRKKKILSFFNKYVRKNDEILEVGAGTGNIAQALMQEGYKLSVGELHYEGLLYAQSYGMKNCYQFDIMSPPFEEHFDVVSLFDVLEHIEDDNQALNNIHTMLKQDGRLILTVPAHQWLWNRYDRVEGHFRRYTIADLKKKLQAAGFEVVQARYFFMFILPLLYLRTWMKKDDGSAITEQERDKDMRVNPVMNGILKAITYLEFTLCRILPNIAGGSIILVAKKQP
jgi:2-polyprenyl-3-methyl-5-hydroxy-6-metoxy-1,4-benzoquinol methylase